MTPDRAHFLEVTDILTHIQYLVQGTPAPVAQVGSCGSFQHFCTKAETVTYVQMGNSWWGSDGGEGRQGGHAHGEEEPSGRTDHHNHSHHTTHSHSHSHSHAPITFERAAQWAARLEDPLRLEQMKLDQLVDQVIRPLAFTSSASSSSDAVVIAEIGAGTGALALRLARMCPTARIIATDTETGMVEYLTAKANEAHLGNITVQLSNSSSTPSLPAQANCIVMCTMYHHVDAPLRVGFLRALKSSLAPGGAIVNFDYAPGDHGIEGPPAWMRLSPEDVTREFASAGYSELPRPPGWGPAFYVQAFTPE